MSFLECFKLNAVHGQGRVFLISSKRKKRSHANECLLTELYVVRFVQNRKFDLLILRQMFSFWLYKNTEKQTKWSKIEGVGKIRGNYHLWLNQPAQARPAITDN